jgi:chemotaxis response regulator CheB
MPRGTSELPSAGLAFVVIAASAGGISAIGDILANLTADFPAPIAMVQHRAPIGPVLLAQFLQLRTMLIVKDAESGDVAQAGSVYLAPQNHHLVVMNNRQLEHNQIRRSVRS